LLNFPTVNRNKQIKTKTKILYSKEKNMQIILFKRRDIHTSVNLAGKCSKDSATLIGGGRAWVYMEHKLGGDT
jgi:hypothetical protein